MAPRTRLTSRHVQLLIGRLGVTITANLNKQNVFL
jgi:hypothetical protein